MSGPDSLNKITRREAIARIGGAAFGLGATSLLTRIPWAAADEPRKPNLIVIVADDLGYGDLSSYGCQDISTPNIDALAAQGVRFSHSYVPVAVCSPTRVSILTGKYPQRTSLPGLPNSGDMDTGLGPDEILLPEILKPAGYSTGIVGKWHLGYGPRYRPRKQGFDEFFGYLSGWSDYIDHTYNTTEKWMFRNDVQQDQPGYLTDVLAREAKAFIDRHRAHPFFLYLPMNAPHGPHKAPDGTVAETRAVYRSVMENFDSNVGQVMQKLRDTGLENDTFVIFISDNGADEGAVGSNAPLRGGKRTAWEGGVRTPCIAKWPGHIPAGQVSSQPIIAMDIYNTMAAAAGAKIPPGAGVDGRNIINVMKGTAASPHEYLFLNFGNAYGVRRGQWKLVVQNGSVTGLYDVVADPGESVNRASQQPTIVQELQNKLAQWQTDVTRREVYW